jgi:hypothetical protein
MKNKSALKWLIPVIGLLALGAAGLGLFYDTPGRPYAYTNHRGETVMLHGHGLYFYDTVSSAAQTQGNDAITLAVGLPLLAVSAWLACRGSLRGRLLLAGTFGFFLYTYMSMSMLTAYNALFLVYVVLFSTSLLAFILTLLAFDLPSLPGHFSPRLPRRWMAGLLFAVAAFLLLAWLGRIVTPWLQGTTPALENTTTFVIQAMDLGLLVPLALLSGGLLLRNSPWGYLLASVTYTKGITMGLAVSAMGINMAQAGVPDSLVILVPFLAMTAVILVTAVVLLRNISECPLIAWTGDRPPSQEA